MLGPGQSQFEFGSPQRGCQHLNDCRPARPRTLLLHAETVRSGWSGVKCTCSCMSGSSTGVFSI